MKEHSGQSSFTADDEDARTMMAGLQMNGQV
jgi:hypothetical protein